MNKSIKNNNDKNTKLIEEHNKLLEESKLKMDKLTQENAELNKNLNLLKE